MIHNYREYLILGMIDGSVVHIRLICRLGIYFKIRLSASNNSSDGSVVDVERGLYTSTLNAVSADFAPSKPS